MYVPDVVGLTERDFPFSRKESITPHDSILSSEELWKWEHFLLAKGCDERLKDNPYFDNERRN